MIGNVKCPKCKGRTCDMCKGSGVMPRQGALMWCELMQTCDDVTQREKDRIYRFAKLEYGVTIKQKPDADDERWQNYADCGRFVTDAQLAVIDTLPLDADKTPIRVALNAGPNGEDIATKIKLDK